MHQKIQGLYAIADNMFRPELAPAELAHAFLMGGCRLIQLRKKTENGKRRTENRERKIEIRKWAEQIMSFKNDFDFTFIINDHVDVALEIGADGVHVGADDMPVAEVRKKVGDKMLIGYSSHSLEEALQAEEGGADYVAFGAIFPTKTKGPGHPVQGLEKLRAVVEAVKIPIVAIGGINKENFRNVLETGVASIAMITALTDASDIAKRSQQYTAGFFWLPHS